MQYINLNKVVEMESDILDLLLISIDDQIKCIDENDGIKVIGDIAISGKVKLKDEEKNFSDNIELNIFLTMDEIVERNSLNVSVNDFSYSVENNKLYLNISLKIEGLKEIETSFLAKEDIEDISKEKIEKIGSHLEIEEEKKVYIDVDVNINEGDNKELIEESGMNFEKIEDDKVLEDSKEFIRKELIEEDEIKLKEKTNKKSLLKCVFLDKKIKEEISWKLHCVKNESTYKEIAEKYKVEESKIVLLNGNEKIEEGKLIFIPIE